MQTEFNTQTAGESVCTSVVDCACAKQIEVKIGRGRNRLQAEVETDYSGDRTRLKQMEEMEDGGCGRVRLLGVRVCRTSASIFAIVPAPGRNAISFPPADMRIMSSARKLSRTNSS